MANSGVKAFTPHSVFKSNDRVRLKRPFANSLMKRATVDWLARVGSVKRCNNYDAHVLWDGRESVDIIPVKGLEKI